MNRRNILILLIAAITIFGGYKLYVFTEFIEDLGECEMDVGPIYGSPIEFDFNDVLLEYEFDIPNGRIGLINVADSLSPKLIKLNLLNEVEWAVEFEENLGFEIQYKELSNIKLKTRDTENAITFFNLSHSEPGAIYLDKEYNFKFMCLKMF